MNVEREKTGWECITKENGKRSSLCYDYFLFFLTHRTAREVRETANDDIMCRNSREIERKKENSAALVSCWSNKKFDGNGIDDFHVFFLSSPCRSSTACFEQVRARMSVIFATTVFFTIHQHRSMSSSWLTSSHRKLKREREEGRRKPKKSIIQKASK